MSIAFTDEQDELRSVVRRFLEAKSPEAAVRAQMETESGFDEAVWLQMSEQMGLQGLVIPEEFGGAGFGSVELSIVLEEMGRALLCAPYFATVVLAAQALIRSGDRMAMAAYLPGIASGQTIATLAFVEPNGRWDVSGIEARAVRENGQWQISGTKSFVLDGRAADLLLVVARTDAGFSLFAVDGSDHTVSRTALETMDLTRKLATVELTNAVGVLVGEDGAASALLAQVLDLAAVGLAAEQVGGAQRVLEMAVDYAKVRTQFGQLIGSFQAIKHKCADMLVQVESAKSAAYHAAWVADTDAAELPAAASLAKAYCSDAYFFVATENIQVHGGIGFTWEHPAHLYFKRAKSSELLFGDAFYHRELLAQRLGI